MQITELRSLYSLGCFFIVIYLFIHLFYLLHTKLSKTTVPTLFLQFMYQCKNKLIFKAVSIFLSVIFRV